MYNIDELTDEVEIGGSGTFKLGLNQGVVINNLQYQTKDGYESLNIEFGKEDKKMYFTLYKEKPGKDEEDNKKKAGYVGSVMLHLMKAYGTEPEVKAHLGSTVASFQDFCNKVITFVQPRMSKTIDVFLQYKKPKEGEDTKYFEVPTRMFNGYFFAPGSTKVFKSQNSWEVEGKASNGLRYIAADGTVHSFIRDEKYLETESWVGYGKGTNLTTSLDKAVEKAEGSKDAAAW